MSKCSLVENQRNWFSPSALLALTRRQLVRAKCFLLTWRVFYFFLIPSQKCPRRGAAATTEEHFKLFLVRPTRLFWNLTVFYFCPHRPKTRVYNRLWEIPQCVSRPRSGERGGNSLGQSFPGRSLGHASSEYTNVLETRGEHRRWTGRGEVCVSPYVTRHFLGSSGFSAWWTSSGVPDGCHRFQGVVSIFKVKHTRRVELKWQYSR